MLFVTLTIVGGGWIYYNIQNTDTHSICFIKNITGIPCPSCGATRSLLAFINGEFLNAIWINPLGVMLMPLVILIPIWVMFDLLLNKDGLYRMYLKFEAYVTKAIVRNILIIIILMNWAWNIVKNL